MNEKNTEGNNIYHTCWIERNLKNPCFSEIEAKKLVLLNSSVSSD